jgi:hypothetical protein
MMTRVQYDLYSLSLLRDYVRALGSERIEGIPRREFSNSANQTARRIGNEIEALADQYLPIS